MMDLRLCRPTLLRIDTPNTQRFSRSFFPFCIKVWNELGPEIRNASKISPFKKLPIFNILPTQKSLKFKKLDLKARKLYNL